MKKISEAQKWVAYWLNDGYEFWRIVDYCYVKKHPFEYRVSIATFNSMFDKGLIELDFEMESDIRRFCLTKRAADLWKAGDLRPSMKSQNKVSAPAMGA